MSLPIYALSINDSTDDQSGIYAVSIVSDPAIESNFIALSKDDKLLYLSKSDKQILTGAVLIPNQLIYRHSKDLGSYYVTFTAEEIEKISHKMMRSGVALHNTTHQHQYPLNGNCLVESWIINDPANDKANSLGLTDLPKGTLMCSYKIEDPDYWQNEIVSGNTKGFSIEGFFEQNHINFSKIQNPNIDNKMKKETEEKSSLQNVKTFFAKVLAMFENQSFTLQNGSEVVVEEDQTVRFAENQEQVPDGEHVLKDGRLLVVNNGKLVEIKEVADAAKQDFSKINFAKIKAQLEEEVSAVKRDFKDVVSDMQELITELANRIDELEKVSTDAKQVSQNTKEELAKYTDKTPSTETAPENRMNFATQGSSLDRITQAVKLQNKK